MRIDVSMPRLACVALSLLLAASFAGREAGDRVVSASNAGDTMNEQARGNSGDHLTADQTIADLLGHPAFSGFGRLLLPWDDRAYDNRMRLRDVGALLPYHSHVDPGTVVSALNHMIDDVNNGKTIFYEFYTEAEKKEQPAKANTGLFFFRGKPGAPFAVIAPGGGFSYIGSVHEGFPYAVAISKRPRRPILGEDHQVQYSALGEDAVVARKIRPLANRAIAMPPALQYRNEQAPVHRQLAGGNGSHTH